MGLSMMTETPHPTFIGSYALQKESLREYDKNISWRKRFDWQQTRRRVEWHLAQFIA